MQIKDKLRRIHHIKASSLSAVRSRETVPKEKDKKKKEKNLMFQILFRGS